MTRVGFHWTAIEDSEDLRIIGEIFKAADGPLSAYDVSELSRSHAGARPRIAPTAASTRINELGRNNGWEIAGGLRAGKWPDGSYKYWLVGAPGWYPRWTVTADKRIIKASRIRNSQEDVAEVEAPSTSSSDVPVEIKQRRCMSCGSEIGIDGPPFCNEECKSSFLGFKKG